MSSERSGGGRALLIVVGVALMVFGVYAMAWQTGLVSAWFPRLNWSELRTGLTLILLGGFVIWLARGGLRSPAAGTRLYRSAEDRWIAGVLGGLARYFGVDSTLLRLAFIALLLLGAGWPVVGYILMAILVPRETAGAPASAAVPVTVAPPPSTTPGAVPVPAEAPSPPAPPEAPAPPASEPASGVADEAGTAADPGASEDENA